jgi:site-specific DNA recombinase
MIAEYEREKILERTRRGRRYAAKQGKLSVFSSAPFGYRRIPKQPGGPETHWEVDPPAAAVVRLIFELVGIQRYPLGRVQRELFARGILTATGKEQWNRATVRDILLNPAYQGTAKYGRERLMPRKPGRRAKRGDPRVPRRFKVAKPTLPEEQETILVPSIVDAKLFEAVGEIMAENRKRERERKGGSKYLLSGLLVCGCCQHAYCARKTHHSRMIYRCLGGDRYRRLNKPLCDNPCVDGEALEQRVWDELCELLQNPERIKEELQRRRNQNPSETPKLQQLETKVATLRGRLDRLIDDHTLGHIERSEFESRVSVFRGQYNRELKALENLRGKVQDEREEDWVANSLNTLAKQVAEGLAQAQFPLKRELLKLLISVVEIHKDEIRIVYRVPSRPFLQSPDKSWQLQHCLLRPSATFPG